MKRIWTLIVAGIGLCSACAGEVEAPSAMELEGVQSASTHAGERFDEEAPAEEPVFHVVVTPGVSTPLVPVTPWPHRSRKRMDLDQLEAAFIAVTGGIGWTQGGHADGANLFEELALTLGKPDYQSQTREDLVPGVLFQKFLGDAARQACARLVLEDLAAPVEERILVGTVDPAATLETDPTGIEENLSRLLMRFHSRVVPAGSTQLNSWRWLFASASHVADEPVEAWQTVCVGLMSHPDFFSY